MGLATIDQLVRSLMSLSRSQPAMDPARIYKEKVLEHAAAVCLQLILRSGDGSPALMPVFEN